MTRSGGEAPGLWQLVYVSAAAPGFELADLESVLRVSRERNARAQISGILLFEGRSFLQVLEGERAPIDALLETIRADARHDRTTLLLREPIEQRSFADWTMGYTRVALGELRDGTGLNDFFSDDQSFSDLDGERVRRVLELFRSGAYRQRLT
jgi:hypothetical protein